MIQLTLLSHDIIDKNKAKYWLASHSIMSIPRINDRQEKLSEIVVFSSFNKSNHYIANFFNIIFHGKKRLVFNNGAPFSPNYARATNK